MAKPTERPQFIFDRVYTIVAVAGAHRGRPLPGGPTFIYAGYTTEEGCEGHAFTWGTNPRAWMIICRERLDQFSFVLTHN